MQGLSLWWGKPRLVISRWRSVSSSSQKPLLWPVCWLWVAGPQSFLHAPPGSVYRHCTALLAATLLLDPPLAGTLMLLVSGHPTATHRLGPYCFLSLAGIPSARSLRCLLYPPRSSDPSVTASCAMALPPCLQPKPEINVIIRRDGRFMLSVSPRSPCFPIQRRSHSSPSFPEMALAKLSFVLGSLQKGLGLTPCTFR